MKPTDHCKASSGKNSNEERSRFRCWLKYKWGTRSSHPAADQWLLIPLLHTKHDSLLCQRNRLLCCLPGLNKVFEVADQKRIAGWQACARINPRCWRLDTTPWAKERDFQVGADLIMGFYFVFSHSLYHSNLEIVGRDETNLGVPCATASKRGKKEKSANGGRQI